MKFHNYSSRERSEMRSNKIEIKAKLQSAENHLSRVMQ